MERPALPDPPPGVDYRACLEDGHGGEVGLSLEVRAMRPEDLAASVDEILRSLCAHAALVGAVFEARVARLAEPAFPDPAVIGGLARHLSSSGLGVSFGPARTPAPRGAAVCLGAGGPATERRLQRILDEHPAWRPVRVWP